MVVETQEGGVSWKKIWRYIRSITYIMMHHVDEKDYETLTSYS